ncbi:MAG: hypothetical protein LBG71_06475 [Clostridiales Family XIII bacterium]|jgi:hypothetical protein|nr:hypothetical protein [Clostridiales Family XIII bacterium]
MNYEANFGKELLKCTATSGEVLKKRLLFFGLAFIFFAAGILEVVSPGILGEVEQSMLLKLIFFAGGSVCVLGAFFLVRFGSAVLYERGFAVTNRSKVTAMDFNEVKGISDATIRNVRQITVVKKDGEKVTLANGTGGLRVSNFHQFADDLGTLISSFLLKDVTAENIDRLSISFGDKLELAGGRLIHDAGGKKGKVSIPLEAVRNVELPGDDGYWLSLMGAVGENGKAEELASIRVDKALNLETLFRILRMVPAKMR